MKKLISYVAMVTVFSGQAMKNNDQELEIPLQPRLGVLTDFFVKYWDKKTILIPESLSQIN